jgi:NAD-dependent dihydropyrimidine dehydrogenase PreA subunit
MVEDGKVAGLELMRCIRVFDEAGRFRPQFDEGNLTVVDVDSVVLAIGQAPELSFLTADDGLELTPAGTLRVDPITLATSRPGVFAGGDAAFPPALLITAAQQGKVAARSIDAYVSGRPLSSAPTLHVTIEELPTDRYRMPERYEQSSRMIPEVPLSRRSGITEVELRFSAEEAQLQAERCLYCHVHPIYDGNKCILCNRCVDICPEHCLHFTLVDQLKDSTPLEGMAASAGPASVFLYDEEKCIRCGLCAIRCPTSAITMERLQFEERQD